jgi:hypothetical protein
VCLLPSAPDGAPRIDIAVILMISGSRVMDITGEGSIQGSMIKKKGSDNSPNPFIFLVELGRDRTDDPLNAIQALSQLSYNPMMVYFWDLCAH